MHLNTPSSPSMGSRRGRCILIVDDDADIRQVGALLLARMGFTVDVAADGEDAWRALSGGSYDLVLTDEDMPRLGGSALIARMRACQVRVPAILMSGRWANPLPGAASADGFLAKPFSLSALLEQVGRQLSTNLSVGDRCERAAQGTC